MIAPMLRLDTGLPLRAPASSNGWATRHRDLLVGAVVLLLAAIFLFVDARPMPILLWDESRNMVNALEMDRTGLGLVTTYQGAPDLWNTKPPLMIWLMVASIRLFGASEWSLRLPGMLASLGTLVTIMWFVRRQTGSIWTGAIAVALLTISPALLGEHGARTADYDSLLTFFVTAYLVFLFGAVHRARPARWTCVAIVLCVIGAVMTKSIAGVTPGLGVGLYLLLTGRFPRLWRSWRYLAMAAAVVAAIGLFLLCREMSAPGYLATSWYNDVGGRFVESLETDRKPFAFYIDDLRAGYFSASLLLILSPLAMRWMSARSRLVLIYCWSVAGAFLLVISLGASKLHHYVLPVLPFMAIAAALTFRAIFDRLIRTMRGDSASERIVAITLALVAIVPLVGATQGAFARRSMIDVPFEGAASRRYAALFDRLAERRLPITVVDPGFVRINDAHYTPVLLAYRLIWQRRGVAVGWTIDLAGATRAPGIVASCNPEVVPLLARGTDVGGAAGCAAILRR